MNKTEEEAQCIAKLYIKVIKDFPEVKESEIELNYNPFSGLASFSLIDHLRYRSLGEIVFKPTLQIGLNFFKFKDEDKEAIIAHELGHYISNKKLSNKRIDSRMRHNQELWNLEYALNNNLPSPFNEHKTKRLKQFKIARENKANKEAAKAGYGKTLLKLHIDSLSYATTDFEREQLKAYISSLEKILKEEKK